MLNDLIVISREAGSIVREGFGSRIEIELKKQNDKNLVTQIDKASELAITGFIKKKYPYHNILAEESGELNNHSEYLWVIDPLDGTTNFAYGLPIFAVSIGLQKNNETICGVVYDVMNDVMFTTEKGGGAFANGKKISVNENNSLGTSFLVTGFPYNIAENPEGALDKFAALVKASRAVRRLGSAALDLCYVANGIFDGFWEINLQPWDMCAGILLIEEAGGMVTDFNGNKMDIFSPHICATNGKIHLQLLQYLK